MLTSAGGAESSRPEGPQIGGTESPRPSGLTVTRNTRNAMDCGPRNRRPTLLGSGLPALPALVSTDGRGALCSTKLQSLSLGWSGALNSTTSRLGAWIRVSIDILHRDWKRITWAIHCYTCSPILGPSSLEWMTPLIR